MNLRVFFLYALFSNIREMKVSPEAFALRLRLITHFVGMSPRSSALGTTPPTELRTLPSSPSARRLLERSSSELDGPPLPAASWGNSALPIWRSRRARRGDFYGVAISLRDIVPNSPEKRQRAKSAFGARFCHDDSPMCETRAQFEQSGWAARQNSRWMWMSPCTRSPFPE